MANLFKWQIGDCCGCGSSCHAKYTIIGCNNIPFPGVTVTIESLTDGSIVGSAVTGADGVALVPVPSTYNALSSVTITPPDNMRYGVLGPFQEYTGCNAVKSYTPPILPGYACNPFLIGPLTCPPEPARHCLIPTSKTLTWNDGVYGPVTLTYQSINNITGSSGWKGSTRATLPACKDSFGRVRPATTVTLTVVLAPLGGYVSYPSFFGCPFDATPNGFNITQVFTYYYEKGCGFGLDPSTWYQTYTESCPPATVINTRIAPTINPFTGANECTPVDAPVHQSYCIYPNGANITVTE